MKYLALLTAWLSFPMCHPGFAEDSYIGLDGKVHVLTKDPSLQSILALISEIKDAMYANSGGVGDVASLNRNGGEQIIADRLTWLLREMVYYEKLGFARGMGDPLEGDKKANLENRLRTEADNTPLRELRLALSLERNKTGVEEWAKERVKTEKLLRILEQTNVADLDKDQKRRLKLDLESVREKLATFDYRHGPQKRLLRLMESIPKAVEDCHKELFELIPAVLTRPKSAPLSPALMKAVKARFVSNPDYALLFQNEMRIDFQTGNRKEATPGALQIGSPQGLELFLAAGDALPPENRANLGKTTGMAVRVRAGPFDINTAPLFARLQEQYGQDVGPENGLKFQRGSTPTKGSLSAGHAPRLAQAVGEAVAPDPRSPIPSHFSLSPECNFTNFLPTKLGL